MTRHKHLSAILPREQRGPRPVLVWARRLPDWQLVLRCLYERGDRQARSLREMDRRGLRLSASQRAQAGLSPVRGVAA